MSFDARPDPDRIFVDALTEGKLLIQTCLKCGEHCAPPTEACPTCGSVSYSWHPSRGRGCLERTIMLGEPDAFGDDPYVTRAIGAVRLSEGPTVSVRVLGDVPAKGAHVLVTVLSGSLVARAIIPAEHEDRRV
ncbi:Zn-ribbon domain-containing OB-fold protein [Tropicimonas sp. S265A]|uniref:Zn-ribbon domain-containing OB-fold protein n=1 Tax=Tropicimonas sp. S265A TaxID=3415134 RepID=UPI003C7B8547